MKQQIQAADNKTVILRRIPRGIRYTMNSRGNYGSVG